MAYKGQSSFEKPAVPYCHAYIVNTTTSVSMSQIGMAQGGTHPLDTGCWCVSGGGQNCCQGPVNQYVAAGARGIQ